MCAKLELGPAAVCAALVAGAATSACGQFAALADRAGRAGAASTSSGGVLYRSVPPLTLSLLQEQPEAEPPAPGFWSQWEGTVSFGLNGNSGNTENMSFRGALGAKRKTEEFETTLGFLYAYKHQDSDSTENRARLDGRNDWLMGEGSPWRYFISGFAEYDEFQDWDYRLGGFTGLGYDFIKNERTTLIGRAGLGTTADFGGEEDEVRFEGFLGFDWTHQVNDRNKLYASATYFPDFSEVPEFRVDAKAGWEIKLDDTNGMFLNLGLEDRYDSSPGGDAKSNDLAYFALLGWNF